VPVVAHEADVLPRELRDHPRYRVLGVLGCGGMGAVYRAEHRILERPVVIKVLRPDLVLDAGLRERFRREARLAARLAHPNVVTVYEAEQVGPSPLLVMEFVDGLTFTDLVRQRGPLPVPVACELVRQAALGLQHLHERGLVHRDVKPGNLMVTADGLVKVLDLGLAFLQAGTGRECPLVLPQQSMGTIDYMAPEQWKDCRGVDIRADIYSLGCTLYHLLAGSPPFDQTEQLDVVRQMWAHSLLPVPPIRDKRSDVPEGLSAILSRMTAKNRDERYVVPAEVVAALEPFAAGCDLARYLADGTVRTSPAPPPPKAPRLNRRRWLVAAGLTLAAGVAGGVGLYRAGRPREVAVRFNGPPVRVGVLHSLSGTMAISERSVVDATRLAIAEVNQEGGVLGRKVEAVVEDGASDGPTFARLAEKLITQDRVSALFGCWTSASRKHVKPVVERHDHLLFYPLQYEGLEQSPNIVYTGAAPNQQIIPAVRWCCAFLNKKRLFLVGSDYIFPRAANAIIRDQVAALGGQVVGEDYLPLGSLDAGEAVKGIVAARPDVILNTINGDSNVAFFRTLHGAGVTPDQVPTVSFSITEEELSTLNVKHVTGTFAAWNYFMSLDRPRNREFVARFQSAYGRHRVVTDPMESAWTAVHLWAQAVRSAGSDDARAVRAAVKGQDWEAPGGPVRVDPATQHTDKVVRIGKVVDGRGFEVVYSSERPIAAVPYPDTRSREDWDRLLAELNRRWGGQWENRGK
jgi:urea transport system substrate-binding protein